MFPPQAVVAAFDCAVSPAPEQLIARAAGVFTTLTFTSPLARSVLLSLPMVHSLLGNSAKILALLPLLTQARCTASLLRLTCVSTFPYTGLSAEDQRGLTVLLLRTYTTALTSPIRAVDTAGGAAGVELYPHVGAIRAHYGAGQGGLVVGVSCLLHRVEWGCCCRVVPVVLLRRMPCAICVCAKTRM
jgi:hypothetical protein